MDDLCPVVRVAHSWVLYKEEGLIPRLAEEDCSSPCLAELDTVLGPVVDEDVGVRPVDLPLLETYEGHTVDWRPPPTEPAPDLGLGPLRLCRQELDRVALGPEAADAADSSGDGLERGPEPVPLLHPVPPRLVAVGLPREVLDRVLVPGRAVALVERGTELQRHRVDDSLEEVETDVVQINGDAH